MQIAGTVCGHCEAKIVFENEGRGCSKCLVAFHRRCLMQPATCPKCRTNLGELAAAFEKHDEQHNLAVRLGAGRRIVLFLMGLLMLGPTVLMAVVVFAGIREAEALSGMLILDTCVRFFLSLALCAGLYFGSPGVKGLLQIVSLLGFVFCVLGVWRAASDGHVELAMVRTYSCIALGFFFFALTFVPSVDVFLRRRLLAMPRG